MGLAYGGCAVSLLCLFTDSHLSASPLATVQFFHGVGVGATGSPHYVSMFFPVNLHLVGLQFITNPSPRTPGGLSQRALRASW